MLQTLCARRIQINDIKLLLKSLIDSRLLHDIEAYVALKPLSQLIPAFSHIFAIETQQGTNG